MLEIESVTDALRVGDQDGNLLVVPILQKLFLRGLIFGVREEFSLRKVFSQALLFVPEGTGYQHRTLRLLDDLLQCFDLQIVDVVPLAVGVVDAARRELEQLGDQCCCVGCGDLG